MTEVIARKLARLADELATFNPGMNHMWVTSNYGQEIIATLREGERRIMQLEAERQMLIDSLGKIQHD